MSQVNPSKLKKFAKQNGGGKPPPFGGKGKGRGGGGGPQNGGGDGDDSQKPEKKSIAEVLPDVVAHMNDGEHDERVEAMLANFDPETDDYPDAVKDHDLWDEAVTEVDPDGDGDEKYDSPWQVVSECYIEAGGELGPLASKGGSDGGDQDDEEDEDDMDRAGGDDAAS
jgi:hypothetical protein